MTEFLTSLENRPDFNDKEKEITNIIELARQSGFTDVEVNVEKPWGAYVRFDSGDARQFIEEFFPGLTEQEATRGIEGAELSPKILLVSPKQRLSLQKHARRAERWRFLTDGAYYKSMSDDDAGELQYAKSGDVVQFEKGEIHRLCGLENDNVIVAEIWQHSDRDNPSNEDDIVRLQDDYSR